jgi:PAS domain S-box-containing protein
LRGRRTRTRWSRLPTAIALVGIVATTAAAPAATPAIPACAAIDARALPAPDACRRGFASADPAALYALADARMQAGDLASARGALDCAATRLAHDPDAAARYEWVRRLGVLAYRDEKIDAALAHFRCALSIAEARGDRAAIAKQLKNVGSALRRDGQLHDALRTLERGLAIARADRSDEVGGTLANIADVYRDLDDRDQAEAYIRQAMAAFHLAGNEVEAAHMRHGLGKLALEAHDTKAAIAEFDAALAALLKLENVPYRLRVHADLALAALEEHEVARADREVSAGLALAHTHGLTPPAELQLVAARVDRLRGKTADARKRLREALSDHPASGAERAGLLDELSLALEQEGRHADALGTLRDAREAEHAQLRAANDRRLAFLRTRFEVSERERVIAERGRTIAVLRQRTLMLWLVAVSALAALFAVSIVFLRRQQRARLVEAANRARYEEMLARYRREADALGNDRDLLQGLFDSRGDALCLLDADGTVLAANRAACPLLGAAPDGLAGRPLSERLSVADAAALATALERMEDSASQTLVFAADDARPALHIELSPWEQGDGRVVMRLATPAADTGTPPAPDAPEMAPVLDEDAARAAFRLALVDLMLAVIEAWERSTGKNRIELAERSRIWRINIDDGRLRARAMERYLSLSRLPQNPRWRDVLRLAYYVLGECRLEPAERDDLQRRVDGVLAYTRRSALA